MYAFLLSPKGETEGNVKGMCAWLHPLFARWLNTKGRWQEHPRSYSVVAHHEGLSFLRPGFKSRYEHHSIDFINHLFLQSTQIEYFSAEPEIAAPPIPGRSPVNSAVNPPVSIVIPNPPATIALPIVF